MVPCGLANMGCRGHPDNLLAIAEGAGKQIFLLLGKTILLRGKPTLKMVLQRASEIVDFHKTYIGTKLLNSIWLF
jgi:hypothetical protein